MNLSYFIAKRISSQQKAGFSATMHKIGVFSIGIGLAAAILAFLIMQGFQETIKQKMYSFSGHLVVTRISMNNSIEENPMDYNIPLYNRYKQDFPGIQHIQEYANKAGLIKTDNEILGVVIKGVGKSFNVDAFAENILEGRFINFPDSASANEVVISKIIADKLLLKTGDEVVIHFFQNPPRLRKLKVTGIYETNLSEYFDSQLIISDIRMVQRLNDWADSIAGGLEVFVNANNDIDAVGDATREQIDYDLNVTPTHVKYSQIFDWLGLLNRQVNILLIIILTVICVNMISIVLIMVMERTQMIGMLKAMGGTDTLVRKIFINSGIYLISRGLLLGNVLGLGICLIQDRFKIIPLNAHDYYMDAVPISWHWDIVIILNVLMFVVVTAVLLIPTLAISRISPIKAIKFD